MNQNRRTWAWRGNVRSCSRHLSSVRYISPDDVHAAVLDARLTAGVQPAFRVNGLGGVVGPVDLKDGKTEAEERARERS